MASAGPCRGRRQGGWWWEMLRSKAGGTCRASAPSSEEGWLAEAGTVLSGLPARRPGREKRKENLYAGAPPAAIPIQHSSRPELPQVGLAIIPQGFDNVGGMGVISAGLFWSKDPRKKVL